MFVITLRSIVFSAAALLIVLTSVAAAQEAQSTPDPSQTQPAIQSDVESDDTDDGELVRAEPDFRVLNLPSTLRLPAHGSSFQMTHRFNGNLRRGGFNENAGNLFGLDQGAAVGFEYRFGVTRHVQAAVYRTAIDKTFQFYGKYDAWRQGPSLPVSLSGVVSVEGADNFQERYAPAVGVVVSRKVADRYAAYLVPMWVGNTAAALATDVDEEDQPDVPRRSTVYLGAGGRARVTSTLYLVGEFTPRLNGYAPDDLQYGVGVEKRVGGHAFSLTFTNSFGTTYAQIARGGAANTLYLGFNLGRKFY
jgi:hypothetical protein